MKIKTITCHKVYNYGASLQAYALLSYLQKNGHDVEIIDFQPSYHCNRYNLVYIPELSRFYPLCKKNSLLKYVVGPLVNRSAFKTWGRKKRFDSFTRDYLCLTRKCYHNIAELRIAPPCADLYIAGSDQIWNTDGKNGKDPAYYLEFGLSTTKRISYAASFGINSLKHQDEKKVANYLSHFDSISVREQTGVEIIRKLGLNGQKVLDPVFLLQKEEWKRLANKAKDYGLRSNGYILIYDFMIDERIANMAYRLKEQFDVPVVSINDFNIAGYADMNINDAGPLEFLNLLMNAKSIVSSSFHATAFSTIFEKDFYVYPLKGQNNSSRMEDFLHSINAKGRFNCNAPVNPLDYGRIMADLQHQIDRSKDFLYRELETLC